MFSHRAGRSLWWFRASVTIALLLLYGIPDRGTLRHARAWLGVEPVAAVAGSSPQPVAADKPKQVIEQCRKEELAGSGQDTSLSKAERNEPLAVVSGKAAVKVPAQPHARPVQRRVVEWEAERTVGFDPKEWSLRERP